MLEMYYYSILYKENESAIIYFKNLERVVRPLRSKYLGTCFAATALTISGNVFCGCCAQSTLERVL